MAVRVLRELHIRKPTADEVHDYAAWLGMDVEEDQDLFYLAEEALCRPLPVPWRPCMTAEGDIFYFNFETGESVWEHPADEMYRELFRTKKAERDAPVRLVTISCTCDGSEELLVTCCGALNGEEVSQMEQRSSMKVEDFMTVLSKQLEIPEPQLRVMLPCGELLEKDDDGLTLAEVFGFHCLPTEEEKTKRTAKRTAKRARFSDRCREMEALGTEVVVDTKSHIEPATRHCQCRDGEVVPVACL